MERRGDPRQTSPAVLGFPAGVLSPASLLKRAITVLRQHGVKSFCFKALDWARIYGRVVLMQCRLDEPCPDITAHVPVVIAQLKESEIDDYLAFRPDASRSEIRFRLRSGHHCFVARYRGNIVHVGWACTGGIRIGYLKRQIILASGEVHDYDNFTSPAFRGLNISPKDVAHDTVLSGRWLQTCRGNGDTRE